MKTLALTLVLVVGCGTQEGAPSKAEAKPTASDAEAPADTQVPVTTPDTGRQEPVLSPDASPKIAPDGGQGPDSGGTGGNAGSGGTGGTAGTGGTTSPDSGTPDAEAVAPPPDAGTVPLDWCGHSGQPCCWGAKCVTGFCAGGTFGGKCQATDPAKLVGLACDPQKPVYSGGIICWPFPTSAPRYVLCGVENQPPCGTGTRSYCNPGFGWTGTLQDLPNVSCTSRCGAKGAGCCDLAMPSMETDPNHVVCKASLICDRYRQCETTY